MRRTPGQQPTTETQVDPGESVDPRPSMASGFDAHIWSTLHQMSERLGEMNQKIGQVTGELRELKGSVEKHDKMLSRAIFTVGGALAILGILWFAYSNFLKDHIIFK